MLNPIATIGDAQTLAQAIVNTMPEPFIVLDGQLRVLMASRSFYEAFDVAPEQTAGALLYTLGDGQWDIPALRLLLETIIPEQTEMDGFEVDHIFPGIGHKTMLLNARQVIYDDSAESTILLAFTDVTTRRAIEREKAELLKQTEELLLQKQILFQEMQHRVANSLQIIASILLLKARAVTSEETRHHLQDAHQRVMSVAAVQQHLHATDGIDRIEVGTYLDKLCGSLGSSMVGDTRQIAIKVAADQGEIDSGVAVSLGLIVTELLINAIKYAFPVDRAGAEIVVTYEIQNGEWRLVVADNGAGRQTGKAVAGNGGLGTAVVKALAEQLGAAIETTSSDQGFCISITRAGFASKISLAG